MGIFGSTGIWFLIGAILVWFMQAGFAMVETGFTRAKNAGNIIMKNLMDFCLGTIVFVLLGAGLMMGEDVLFGLVGLPNLGIFTDFANYDWSAFFFNLVFCATTATIVSGAMAERTKFLSYCIYSCVISAIVYPVEAHWAWGGGWLSKEILGVTYIDFAGSSLIHMVGGISSFIGALILGVIIGMVIAVIRTAHDSRRAGKGSIILNILNAVCKLYLTIIRGTPMMVQLLIMGFVIMVPKDDTARMVCGIVTLGINSGAYVAEIVRGGLMSVGAGQMEAGRSLGLNYGQTMWLIIIPQAIKNILPALGNEMITLFKDTSLVSVIALRDVTKQAQNIVSTTYQPYVPYISLAVIYLLGVIIMTKLLGIFERRLRESDRR